MRRSVFLPFFMAGTLLAFGCGGSVTGKSDGVVDGDLEEAPDLPDQDALDPGAPDMEAPDHVIDTPPPDQPDVVHDTEPCSEEDLEIARVVPDVLILLDRSNSMAQPPSNPVWNLIRGALVTVTAALDDAVWFGLMSFPNSVPPNECTFEANFCEAPSPTTPLVPIGPGTSSSIETSLMSLTTCGGTPVAMSLQSAHEYLATVEDDHAKHIILATDGAPNCNGELDGGTCVCTASYGCVTNNLNCLDDARTYGVLDAICSAGVGTYVLGMGGAVEWMEVMEGMASHGCTGSPRMAGDEVAIRAALEEILGSVATCRFEFGCGQVLDAGRVNFYLDGEVVPGDSTHAGGWDWVDACDSTSDEHGAVELYGASCDMLMSGEVETIAASYGCPTVEI